ncbi:unnamed protein product [Dibothriocephalus latus]|uniref:Gamma-tubulin complex component n=1 Tax=Dibothriocephalus latus TaxID=60516 RepID=A0A3P7LY60_DIBLA|nr:unnamed protein product [Dibothriocephalus latus]
MTQEEAQLNSEIDEFPEVPFFYILDKSLTKPLQVQARVLDKCLVEHFITHLGLLEYLAFVRQIFFLEHSEIASSLLHPLFHELSSPSSSDCLRSVFDPESLNEALSHISIQRPRGMMEDQLPFRLTRLPKLEPLKDGPFFFDSLAIVYEAPWPLNICLHRHILAKYNSVFCELARVKHAIWALEAVYRHLRSSCQNRTYAYSGIFQASLWRHEMEQVIRCVDAYFATQVVKGSWSAFLRRIGSDKWFTSDPLSPNIVASLPQQLTSVSTLDELCSAHEEYVDGVLTWQIGGVTMGSPFGPFLANVFMGKLEETKLKDTIDDLKFYGQCVDSIFCLTNKTNKANNEIAFLNVLLHRQEDGSI